MYVYICLYMKMHTQWQACMPVLPVMHIYRYIIKIHLIPIFSESMMIYAHILPLLIQSIQVDRAGGKSLPQVPFPSILHYYTTVFWCLTVAAMIVVNIRFGDPRLHSV